MRNPCLAVILGIVGLGMINSVVSADSAVTNSTPSQYEIEKEQKESANRQQCTKNIMVYYKASEWADGKCITIQEAHQEAIKLHQQMVNRGLK